MLENDELFLIGASLEQREQMTRKQLKRAKRALLRKRCSANLIVDLGNTTVMGVSILPNPVLSGLIVAPASGTQIGLSVDLLHTNTYCNLVATGFSASGQLRIQVQTADSDTSGSYTDPTSGLPNFPGSFQSGGILWINSGGTGGGILGAQTSGQSEASGFMVAQGFIRNARFVRANVLSEAATQFGGSLMVGFVSQQKTTGSGGGFSLLPGSGSVTV